MSHKYEKNLIKIGESSKGVIIPKPWLDYHKPEKVVMIADDEIIIRPKQSEKNDR